MFRIIACYRLRAVLVKIIRLGHDHEQPGLQGMWICSASAIASLTKQCRLMAIWRPLPGQAIEVPDDLFSMVLDMAMNMNPSPMHCLSDGKLVPVDFRFL